MSPKTFRVLGASVVASGMLSVASLVVAQPLVNRLLLDAGSSVSFDCPTVLGVVQIDRYQMRLDCSSAVERPPANARGGAASSSNPTPAAVGIAGQVGAPPTRSSTVPTPPANRGSTSVVTTPSFPAPAERAGGLLNVGFVDVPGSADFTGQYPTGVIEWGSGSWQLLGPAGKFSTKSLRFRDPGRYSASLKLLSALRLVSLQAYNSGASRAVVTLSCEAQPVTRVTMLPGELATIATNWTAPCSTVTIAATNNWWTSFSNFGLYPV